MKLAAVHAIAELAHAESPRWWRRPTARAGLRFGARLPDPQAVRPAADRGGRAGGGAGRDGQRRGDAADRRHAAYRAAAEPVRLPVGQRMQPVFAAAKRCAAERVVYAEGEDERVLRAAQVVVDEGLARPMLIGRPRRDRRAHRAVRPAPRARHATASCVDLLDPAVYGDAADDVLPARRAATACRARWRGPRCAAAARCSARCWCAAARPTRCCAAPVGRFADHLRYVRDVIGLRAGRADLRGDADADAAGPPAVHLRHLRQRRPDRRADRRDDAAGGRGGAPLRHHAAAWRCCRTRASAAPTRLGA